MLSEIQLEHMEQYAKSSAIKRQTIIFAVLHASLMPFFNFSVAQSDNTEKNLLTKMVFYFEFAMVTS